jgi:phosphoribosyl-AMP cyclohydrolase
MPTAASVTYPSAAIDSFIAAIQFDAQGLVAAIAQQHDTGEVLMMAWMDRDAVVETMRTGRACYWSRSRKAPWRKGDTSGHIQMVTCASTAMATRCWRWSIRRASPANRAAQLLFPRHPWRSAQAIARCVDMDKMGKDG